jgi:hypothetical protein
MAAETPVRVRLASPATVTLPVAAAAEQRDLYLASTLPVAVAAETPVSGTSILASTLPAAVAAETPVRVRLASPETATLPVAVAAETPVSGTLYLNFYTARCGGRRNTR